MYFVVDLEATCWEVPKVPDLNEIIDIGIVVCDSNFIIIDTWSSLIRPKFNTKLSSFCKKHTSIKQSDVDSALFFSEVIGNFNSWFTNQYNTKPNEIDWFTWDGWDLRCLMGDCRRNNVEFPFSFHRDLREIYMTVKGCDKKSKFGLKDVMEKEGIESVEKLHRGISDAIVTAKIAKIIHPFPMN